MDTKFQRYLCDIQRWGLGIDNVFVDSISIGPSVDSDGEDVYNAIRPEPTWDVIVSAVTNRGVVDEWLREGIEKFELQDEACPEKNEELLEWVVEERWRLSDADSYWLWSGSFEDICQDEAWPLTYSYYHVHQDTIANRLAYWVPDISLVHHSIHDYMFGRVNGTHDCPRDMAIAYMLAHQCPQLKLQLIWEFDPSPVASSTYALFGAVMNHARDVTAKYMTEKAAKLLGLNGREQFFYTTTNREYQSRLVLSVQHAIELLGGWPGV